MSVNDMVLVPNRSQAHVWVHNGVATLTIISNAPEGVGLNWPEGAGPLMVFDTSFDVSVTVVTP